MHKNYFSIFLILLSFLFFGNVAYAREAQDITDWYIKNFESSIIVNQDSSLLITENINADAGNLPDKHGIFRVLPTQVKTDKGVFKTPIELVSIVDLNGQPYQYKTINDTFSHTITWKIGDPDITVMGENFYRITYKVKNAIRFNNSMIDELYWNLLGTAWDVDIDQFSARIVLPGQLTKEEVKISYYTGLFGSKDTSLATYQWLNDHAIIFSSTRGIGIGQGITASLAFPKNIFVPYQFSYWELYGMYFWVIIPIVTFLVCFNIWKKYGKDPKMKHPIPPEFGIPQNITPIQLSMVFNHGQWDNTAVAATIINLAVRGYIKIEEVEKKNFLIRTKDYTLTKLPRLKDSIPLTDPENKLLVALFKVGDVVMLSDIKESFPKVINDIKKAAVAEAVGRGWIIKSGNTLQASFIVVATVLIVILLFIGISIVSIPVSLNLIASVAIIFTFSLFMPKYTQKGIDLLFQIKGFERYMRQAEDYRQQFYEKENIFDRFLPYAIVFGITKLWAKKMETMYGKDFYRNYHPAWYMGASSNAFNPNSFASDLNSVIATISSNTGGESGSGGSGFSGGGGGGGGGGGW